MKVENLFVDGWCTTCGKIKSFSYVIRTPDAPDAVELPETCKCGLTMDAIASGGTIEPGHQLSDVDLARHFPHHVMCTGVGPELYTLPQGSSIYPTGHLEREETLWQIVQEVAETDSTCDGEEDIHGVPVNHFCPFCGSEQVHADRVIDKAFPHHPTCIVTKARELMGWRNAQPRIEVKINYHLGLSDLVDEARRLVDKARQQIERSEVEDGGFDGEVPRD